MNDDTQNHNAKRKRRKNLIIGEIIVVVVLLIVFVHAIDSHKTKSANDSSGADPSLSDVASSPPPDTSDNTTSVVSPAPTPTVTHTVTYQVYTASGKLSSSDVNNLSLGWHNPSNGQNILPSDAALQQLEASGSYQITYKVSDINNDNISVSIGNYSDQNASIACAIVIDKQQVATETAQPGGDALCSANSADSQTKPGN